MLTGKLLAFQHALNPLHIYCRIMDAGLSKGLAMTVSRSYELCVFTFVSLTIKGAIQIHRFFYPRWGLKEELGKQTCGQGDCRR